MNSLLVGSQYTTGEEWRNNSRKNEETEPKQKQCPAVDVNGDGSKVQCCKEQYCIGTWNVRSMNEGKLEVVRQNGKDQRFLQKIKDTQGTYHIKMGAIKDRNRMDLIEEEDIKKWQNTQKKYTNKILMTQITMMVW